jgi:hypothetical protein
VHEPRRERIARRRAGQFGRWQRLLAADEHHVAVPAAAQHPGSASRHTSANAVRSVATWPRANVSGGPSARLTAYSPPGFVTRAAAATNSVEANRRGTRAPAYTSTITRSYRPDGAASTAARASAARTLMSCPFGSGSTRRTSAISAASCSTTRCTEPGRVAAT